MADGEVVNLMQAQLNKASNAVRDMARRIGTNYVLWEQPKELMRKHQIDRIDLADYLVRCDVKETWTVLGVKRYRVEADEADERIRSVILSVHQEVVTIEVVSLTLAEVKP